MYYINRFDTPCRVNTFVAFIIYLLTQTIVAAITASYKESMLIVSEGDGAAVVVIVLSIPSSIDLTVVVLSNSQTACGEYWIIQCVTNGVTEMLQEEVWIMILDHTM